MTGFVSIIIPNLNGERDIADCLRSIGKLDYDLSRVEVVLVDNGSTDGSLQEIEQCRGYLEEQGLARLLVHVSEKNLGAAGAYRLAAELVDDSAVFILKIDNDVIFDRETLSILVNDINDNPKIGLLGCVEYCYDEPDVPKTAGCWFSNILLRPKFSHSPASGGFLDVESPPGTCMLIRKNVLEQVGSFDEQFFVYWDDYDLSYRVGRSGWLVGTSLNTRIWHKGSRTTGGGQSPFGVYYSMRNPVLFGRKHMAKASLPIFLLYFFGWSVPRALWRLKTRELRMAVINGAKDGLKTSLR